MRFYWVMCASLLAACGVSDATDKDASTDETDTDSLPPLTDCGDGVVEGNEECDFGDTGNDDAGNCSWTCRLNPDQRWTLSLQEVEGVQQGLFDAVGVTDATSPLGTGAWRPADADLGSDGLAKLELYVPTYDIRDVPAFQSADLSAFPQASQLAASNWFGEITVGDLADVRITTKHPTGQRPRFYVYIYTQPDGSDDGAIWYGRSLVGFTGYATPLDAPDDTWTTFSVAGDTNQLVFWDNDDDDAGELDGVTLDTLRQMGGYAWSDDTDAVAREYRTEVVKYIALQTSSGTGTVDFDGLVDELVIELDDGRSLTLDLEP